VAGNQNPEGPVHRHSEAPNRGFGPDSCQEATDLSTLFSDPAHFRGASLSQTSEASPTSVQDPEPARRDVGRPRCPFQVQLICDRQSDSCLTLPVKEQHAQPGGTSRTTRRRAFFARDRKSASRAPRLRRTCGV
jgi:hypothetical protein